MSLLDISDEVELKNGRANPFGWSQQEIWYDGIRLGWIECGAVDLNIEGYTHKIIKEDKLTRLVIYKDIDGS